MFPARRTPLMALLVVGLGLQLAAGAAFQRPTPATAGRTHFHFLLDRSGSMSSLQQDVVGGFNSYIAEQQRYSAAHPEDTALFSLVQFDTNDPHEVSLDATALGEVAPLSSADYQPRGGTPLYDAIGRVIARAESLRQPQEEERTVVIIFTDGEENSSREHSQQSVAQLIDAKKEEGWAFIFLGANQDAYQEGQKVGFARGSTQNYMADGDGVRTAFSSLGLASNAYREKARAAKRTSMAMPDAAEAEAYVLHAMSAASDDFFAGNDDAQQDFENRQAEQPKARSPMGAFAQAYR